MRGGYQLPHKSGKTGEEHTKHQKPGCLLPQSAPDKGSFLLAFDVVKSIFQVCAVALDGEEVRVSDICYPDGRKQINLLVVALQVPEYDLQSTRGKWAQQ